ncbi:tetratricopeptide repeat protein [Endozoicomonas sp. G2_1]|uniref:tetratricopeptide repeat protein n=1 Tax=Endozoicomonas sp. G2_1 TaxID=2821091 RepID=UPI001ADBFBE9|nr:tetratricopeptide repeat protein [Endozoicomonas sp. G2_1]MBO9488887.1 tetratricopeptide repeat protein [Endozoicomonas sp. G2_1]
MNFNTRLLLSTLLVSTLAFSGFCTAQTGDSANQTAGTESQAKASELNIDKPLYKPFIERYILDELKQLRQDQQAMRAELTDKVTNARLDVSDRAIRYTADTTNNVFYIITTVATLLVLLGWKSLKDIKDNLVSVTEQRLERMTQEYEKRLNAIELALKERSDQIVAAQQNISDNALIHSLWMRAGLEKSEHEKIKIYDQILDVNPNDVEALTYKADTLLDLDEDSWALSLANQAIENDSDYALAYWQKGCAQAKLGFENEAVADIKKAIELSQSLQSELPIESYFENLKEHPEFSKLVESSVVAEEQA